MFCERTFRVCVAGDSRSVGGDTSVRELPDATVDGLLAGQVCGMPSQTVIESSSWSVEGLLVAGVQRLVLDIVAINA